MDEAVKTTGPAIEGQIDKTEMDEAVKTTETVMEGQIDKTEMGKAVQTTGPIIERQIDKTEMDEAVKTTGIIGIDSQIDKAKNRPRQHQAEPSGSGPSRWIQVWCGFKEPDIDGREDNKQESTQLSGTAGIKASSGSGTECEYSSADKDEIGGDDGGLSMTEEAIAKIWEQGPPRNNGEDWTYFYL